MKWKRRYGSKTAPTSTVRAVGDELDTVRIEEILAAIIERSPQAKEIMNALGWLPADDEKEG